MGDSWDPVRLDVGAIVNTLLGFWESFNKTPTEKPSPYWTTCHLIQHREGSEDTHELFSERKLRLHLTPL
jgi:hypothetical protein